MGQYQQHVFVCTSGETCPTQGDVEPYVKYLRAGALKAGLEEIFTSHIVGGKPVERLVYDPGVKGAHKTPAAH